MKGPTNNKMLVLADQAIYSGTSFLLTILIARYLHISDFGLYSAYVLVIYLAVSAISAWTTQVFQVARDKASEYITFVFWTQIIILVMNLLVIFIIHLFFPFITTYFVLLFGFGFVIYDFGRKILLSIDKPLATLILDSITSILLIIAFFAFRHQGTKILQEMMMYFALVYVISSIIIIYNIRPFIFKTAEYKSYIKMHIKEGKWLFFTAVSQWWAGNLFVVASGIYLGAAALGALRLGQSLFGVLNILLQTFENYVLPQTAQKMVQSQLSGFSYLKEMNYKLAYVFVPVLLIIFLFAPSIMTLAGGAEYKEYAFVLKGLSMLYIFILLSQPIRFVFRSLQMNDHFFYAYFISLSFALATSHWLISTFGLQGVIAGLIGSQIILMIYWSFILKLKNINLWRSSTSY